MSAYEPGEGFPRLLKRIQATKAIVDKFNKGGADYNQDLEITRLNLTNIIKPSQEIKLSLPSHADKLKRHAELKDKLDKIIDKKVLYTANELAPIIRELIIDDKLIDPDELRKLIRSMKNQSNLDANEKTKLLNIIIDKANEADKNRQGEHDEIKVLLQEIINLNNLNNIDDVRSFIKELRDNDAAMKPKEIKDLLGELLEQGKINADENNQLLNELVEQGRFKAPGYPPSYRSRIDSVSEPEFRRIQDNIMVKNNFKDIVDVDKSYGISFNNDDDSYFIGSTNININYSQDDGLVHIVIPATNEEFVFSVEGLIELFGTTTEPNMLVVTKQDVINYGNLLKESNVKDNNISTIKNQKFVIPILKIVNHKTWKKETKNKSLGNLYDKFEIESQKFAGYPTEHEGDGLIILPSSIKEMKERLGMIVASLKAGNTSTDLKNEAGALVDALKKKRGITSKQQRMLLLTVFK